MTKRLRVMKSQCSTCPFRDDGLIEVRELLIQRALEEGSPICHSTGTNRAHGKLVSRRPLLCRGARDLQLRVFYSMGYIAAETDEAWDQKCRELGI
jgi:hypothetical protein